MAVFRMAEMDFAHKFYLGIDKKFVWCDLEYVFDKYSFFYILYLLVEKITTKWSDYKVQYLYSYIKMMSMIKILLIIWVWIEQRRV